MGSAIHRRYPASTLPVNTHAINVLERINDTTSTLVGPLNEMDGETSGIPNITVNDVTSDAGNTFTDTRFLFFF